MIKLTVGLPLYNANKIGWLALESLCRQKNIDFEWELIIMEEHNGQHMGEEEVLKFHPRLKQVGCNTICYTGIPNWIPLPVKWREMGSIANKNSVGFVLQAADCYSQPYRLKETYDLFVNKKADWVQSKYGLFYYVPTDQAILYNWDHHKQTTSLNMATKTSLIKQLPTGDKKLGIDKWMFVTMQKLKGSELKVVWNESDNWKYGVDTHGYNNISTGRTPHFKNPRKVFKKTDLHPRDLLPKDIYSRLKELSNG